MSPNFFLGLNSPDELFDSPSPSLGVKFSSDSESSSNLAAVASLPSALDDDDGTGGR